MSYNAASAPTASPASAPPVSSFDALRAQLPPDQKSIANELDALVIALKVQGAPAAAARLQRLDGYATVVPPEALPGLVNSDGALDELEGAAAAKWHNSWLVVGRNILALAPLLFTWWALSAATGAYQEEIRRHPNLVYQPFLILWENGFGHGGILTFSELAGVDTVLFGVLILMTGAIHILTGQARARARQTAGSLDQVITQLVAVLGRSRQIFSGNPSDWANAVQRVIAKAMDETRVLVAAGRRATEEAQAVAESSRVAVDTTAAAASAFIADVKREFADTVRQLHDDDKTFLVELQRHTEDRLIAAHEETARSMADVFRETAARFDVIAQASQAVVDRAQEAMTQVHQESRAALTELNTQNRDFLADANRESQSTLASTTDQARQVMESLHGAVATFTQQIEQYRQGAQTMVESMAKIGDVTTQLGANAQTFASTAATMDEHVQDATRTQAQFAQQVESAANALGAAAGETRAAATGMQNTVNQLQGAIQGISTLGHDVAQASGQWGMVQQRMSEVVRALQAAAVGLRDVKVQVSLINWPFGKGRGAP